MILYLGNFITDPSVNPTYSLTLAQKLAESYAVTTAGSSKKPFRRLAQMVKALLFRKSKVVLIDAYATRAFWYLVVLTLLCRWKRTPYILLLHSGAWPERWQRSSFWAHPVLDGAAHIVCTSKFLYDRLPGQQPKARVIHNFGEALVEPTLRPRYNGRILWVREFQPRYGDELALQLALRLQEMGAKSTLTMVGPKQATLADRWEQTERPWPSNVELHHRMEPQEWHQLAADYSLFLNTSQVDSFPVSLVQAQALGLPVLSTAVGGIPELITPLLNGWLVDSEDLEAMANIILELEANPDTLLAYSESSLARSLAYQWGNFMPHWMEVFSYFSPAKQSAT